ncbi:MAG: hypothetical protein IPN60_12610 [Saprospiraceae bacterium]|nr:hypothetical protein [Candidatus Opimibacter skivensis]
MKKLYTIGISLLFLSFTVEAQLPGFFEITVTDLPGAATNQAVVKMKAVNSIIPVISTCDGNGAFVTDILTGLTFGIKWPVSSLITQVGSKSSGNQPGDCHDLIDPTIGYGIANGGANILSDDGTTRARPFLANFTPSPIPLDWIPGEWITICTLTITGGNCTTCEALDVYVIGDYPEMEAQADFSPVFAFDMMDLTIKFMKHFLIMHLFHLT